MRILRETFSHIRSFSTDFWVVIAATLMNQVGNMAMVFLVIYLTNQFGLTLSTASFAFAVFSLSMFISGLFSGSFIDSLGPATIMSVSLIINGLTLLFFPFIHSYLFIILLSFLWGFFYGVYRPASQTFVGQLSSPGMYKISYSVYRLAINLGMSAGPAIGGYLAGHSFALVFVVNGITNLLAGFILIVGLAHTTWFKYQPKFKSKLELNLKWLRYDGSLRLFVFGMIPISMVFFQHESTLAFFLNQSLHFPLTFYGLLFTLNTLIIVTCELMLNVAMMNWPYRTNFMLGSFFIGTAFFGLMFATAQWHVILLAIIWTLGEMILYPSASSYIADIAPKKHQGVYMSLYSTCSNIGMLLGPWGGAVLMQHLGANVLWVICGIFGLFSATIFSLISQPKEDSSLDFGVSCKLD